MTPRIAAGHLRGAQVQGLQLGLTCHLAPLLYAFALPRQMQIMDGKGAAHKFSCQQSISPTIPPLAAAAAQLLARVWAIAISFPVRYCSARHD
jgi:hypothetical protein